jgi:hypothetical protein
MTEVDTGIIEEIGDGEVLWVNETGIDDAVVQQAITNQVPELARLTRRLDQWSNDYRGNSREGGLFSQNKYVAPNNMFDEFRLAAQAARDDDIVSNAVETTEQLAFKRVALESQNDDETTIWQQIKDDLNIETRMREIWRELFIVSQCYVAVLWDRKDYRVKGFTESGKKSKKVYKNLLVPKGITLLDPCKVLPVGNFMFNQEELVYIADEPEARRFHETLAAENSSDLIVKQLFTGPYTPSPEFLHQIQLLTGQYAMQDRLFKLNPDNVWRITSTRPQYQMFADVRMRSVFELLDMKHNLREMDRADILGNLNAIILVKKGSEKMPATQPELQQASAQVQNSARIPIIVSDHRMEIEIITRKTDNTLRPERYNNLDSRITSRLFQILSTGAYSSGTAMDNSPGLFKVIAATMESRRDNIRESLMDNIFDKIYEKNDLLLDEPAMNFYPRRIALDFDPHFAQYVYDLFIQGQISHETALAEIDITLAEEAAKRRKEQELYSDIFEEPRPPGAGNGTGDQKTDGRTGGGNNNGGGSNQDSFNSNPRTGSPNNEEEDKSNLNIDRYFTSDEK